MAGRLCGIFLIQFFSTVLCGLISNFYVPGTLVAGPDFSREYPSEVFSGTYRFANATEVLSGIVTYADPTAEAEEPSASHQCTGTKFIECASCNKYAICTGSGEAITEIECGKDKPYCNSRLDGDFCSRTPGDQCEEDSKSTFVCTSPGYFPNLENCRIYHICARDTENKLIASDYICPQGYYFSAEVKACRRQFLSRECTRRELQCTNTTPEPLRYEISSQFFYHCRSTSSKPVVFRCPENSEYRAFDYECKYRCRRPGNFEHSDNVRRHFVCYFEGARLTSRIEECPKGFIFSKSQAVCVMGTTTV